MSDGFGSMFGHVQAEAVGNGGYYGDGSGGPVSVSNLGTVQFGEVFAYGEGYSQYTTVDITGGIDGTTFIGNKTDPHWLIRASVSITIHAPGDGEYPVTFAANGTGGGDGSAGSDTGGGGSNGWVTAGGGLSWAGISGTVGTPSDAQAYGGDTIALPMTAWIGPLPTSLLCFPQGGDGGTPGGETPGGGGHGTHPTEQGFCSLPINLVHPWFYSSIWPWGNPIWSYLSNSQLWFNFGGGGGGGGTGDGADMPGGGGGGGGGAGGIIVLCAPTITIEQAAFLVNGGNGGNGGAGGDTVGGGGGGGGGDAGAVILICESIDFGSISGSNFSAEIGDTPIE